MNMNTEPKKPENLQAFPVITADAISTNLGMTLLDYFAAKAMPGIMNPIGEPFTADPEAGAPCRTYEEIAAGAYLMAAAMLAEREKHL